MNESTGNDEPTGDETNPESGPPTAGGAGGAGGDERQQRAFALFEGWLQKRATGESLPREEFLEQNADLADLLRPMLDANLAARDLLARAFEGVRDQTEAETVQPPAFDVQGDFAIGSLVGGHEATLEGAIMARIKRQVEAAGGEVRDERRARQAVRSVLSGILLTEREKKVLLRALSETEERDPFGCVIAERTRDALVAGLKMADPHAFARGLLNVPHVVFLSGGAGTTSYLRRLEQVALGSVAGDTATAADGLFVLTERSPVQDLLRRLADNQALSMRLTGALRPETPDQPAEQDTAEPLDIEVVQVRRGLDYLGEEISEIVAGVEVKRPAEDPDQLVGQLFDMKYRIVRKLGEGGFGTVYEAVDETGLGNRVAIKVLRPRSGNRVEFRNEARRVAGLSHPNIVDWKYFNETGGGVDYFVMELLEGRELDEILREEEKLEPDRAARILLQILSSLRAAHNVGEGESILHLDLKPKNVFVLSGRRGPRDERIKVIDFGIGQYIGGQEEAELDAAPATIPETGELFDLESVRFDRRDTGTPSGITRCRACTPEYASPEQSAHLKEGFEEVQLDGRSDVYSLGILGFQMLSGRLPFPRPPKRIDMLLMHLTVPPTKMRAAEPGVPRDLARFIDRCLVKDREHRWTADEAYEELERIVNPPAWKAVAKVAAALTLAFLPIGYMLSQRVEAGSEFQLMVQGPDGPESVEEALYFGPEQSQVEVRLPEPDRERLQPGTPLELRDHADGSLLAGLLPTWGEDGVIRISVDPDAPPAELNREAVLVMPKGDARSRAFRVRYATPDESRILGLSVAGLGPDAPHRRVFATGNTVRVVLPVPARELESVALLAGERRWPKPAVEEQVGGAWHQLWRLEELDLPEGRTELTAEVRDRAGNTHTATVAVDLIKRPLAVDATLEGRGLIVRDEQVLLTPRHPARVLLQGSGDRPVDLEWWVESEGARLAGLGGSLTEQTLPISLPLPVAALGEHSGEPFGGTIQVRAKDATHVRYAERRPAVAGEIPFQFSQLAAEFAASLVTAGGAEHGLGDQPVYLPPGTYGLRVARVKAANAAQVDLLIEASATRAEGSEPQHARSDGLLNPVVDDTGGDMVLELREDGEWHVEVLALIEGGDEPVNRGDFRVVVDSNRALEVVSDLVTSDGEVLRSYPEGPVGFVVRRPASEGSADRLRAPIDGLKYTLYLGGQPLLIDVPLPLASLDDAGESPITLALPDPRDGDYRLEVTGLSRAGLPATGARTWTFAASGPRIDLDDTFEPVWRVSTTGQRTWKADVVVEEPNGLEGLIECTLVAPATDEAPELEAACKVDLARTAGPDRYRFTLEHAFDHRWSQREVRLDVVARDEHGNASERSTTTRLETIRPDFPPTIALAAEDGSEPSNGMRLVQVERAVFTLGGRGDAQEQEAFEKAGIPYAYDDSPAEISWALEYAPEELHDYYLDEREVTAAQFAEFLERGYLDPGPWQGCGATPEPGRRDELLARCAALAPDAPFEGARWEEAWAYAAWVGKRLPSVFEWEYAVRGGSAYLSYAGQGNARAVEAAASLAALGEDRTASGLRDLCTGVSEWTASPAVFRNGRHIPQDEAKPYLLAPYDQPDSFSQREYWLVGGSRAEPEYFDFSLHYARDRSVEAGFRCALSAEEVPDLAAGGRVIVRR